MCALALRTCSLRSIPERAATVLSLQVILDNKAEGPLNYFSGRLRHWGVEPCTFESRRGFECSENSTACQKPSFYLGCEAAVLKDYMLTFTNAFQTS